MNEHRDSESPDERLLAMERRLEAVHKFEVERWLRENCAAQREYLTRQLVCVHATEEDLRSAGVDPAMEKTIFDVERHWPENDWESEKLWEITGGSLDGGYGYRRGYSLERSVVYFYLPADEAAKVNARRARKYLDGGGTLEVAEQSEGCYRFDRKFVDAVRAQETTRKAGLATEGGTRDSDNSVEAKAGLATEGGTLVSDVSVETFLIQMLISYYGFATLALLKQQFWGIATFLIGVAAGTIVSDFRTGFFVGLLASLVIILYLGWFYGRRIEAWERATDKELRRRGVSDEFGKESAYMAEAAFWRK